MTKLGETTLSNESQSILLANGFLTVESLSSINSSILANLNGSDARFVMEVMDFLASYKENPDSIRKKNSAFLDLSGKTLDLIERNINYCKIVCCEKMAADFKDDLGDFSAARYFGKLKKVLSEDAYVFSQDSHEYVIALKGYEATRKALIGHLIESNEGEPIELQKASEEVGLSSSTLSAYLAKGVWPSLFLFDGHLVWDEKYLVFDGQTIAWVAGYVRIMGDAPLKTDAIIQILCKTKNPVRFGDFPPLTQQRCAITALIKAGYSDYHYDESSDSILKSSVEKKKWFFD